MAEGQVLLVIGVLGLLCYALRVGGYLAAGVLPRSGWLPRVLRLAPGNLLVAFVAAGICEGGWANAWGIVASVAARVLTGREWAALAAGFAAVATASALPG